MSGSVFDYSDDKKDISLDFNSLRNYGIELIQKWSGNTWTDFNLHDPGVTILEALCYAITDLAYQTDFDITELLADKKNKIDYLANSFFHKQDILTINPVTVTDYRKAIIDEVEEIDNAWLEAVISEKYVNSISGLYDITVQLNQVNAKLWQPGSALEKQVKDKVRATFVAKRNLCEDVRSITILKPVKLKIQAKIQIDAIIVPERALAQIYYALQLAINRPKKYSSERELLQQDYTIDEIYCGPLKNGIIADDDMDDRQLIIDANDLIKRISDIEGVVLVKKLLIAREGDDSYVKQLKLDESEVAFIDVDTASADTKQYNLNKLFDISLVVDNYHMAIRDNLLNDIYQSVIKAGSRAYVKALQKTEDIKATYRDATTYYSIQNYFPHVYGIGHEGLPRSASSERKAQAKQLKAYLMLFEQVLANYQAQVNNIDTFFSNDPAAQTRSYFSKPLYDVPGANDIIAAYTGTDGDKNDKTWQQFKGKISNGYITALNATLEPDGVRIDRKNKVLDHLFARFNETAVVYPVTLYHMLYDNSRKTERMTKEIEWKAGVLRNFSDISYNRIRGFNYLKPNDDQYNFSNKMHALLYIQNKKHSLTSVFEPSKVKFAQANSQTGNDTDNNEHVVDETAWNPEMQKLTFSREEVARLKKENKIANQEPKYKGAYTFPNQDISVLKYAININNYRIAQEGTESYMLLYKAPVEEKWNILSRFHGSAPTIAMLNKLVKYLVGLSKNSEGFYLVEHILLRPDENLEVYGFNLYDRDNRILFEHKGWLTLNKRKEIIEKLLKFEQGTAFEIARHNELMAKNNIALIHKAAAWNNDPDKIDGLIKTSEEYLKQAESILNTSMTALEGSEGDSFTVANNGVAQKNHSIAQFTNYAIKQLLHIAGQKKIADNFTIPSDQREEAMVDHDKTLKNYNSSINNLLSTANQQYGSADETSHMVNQNLLGKLSQLGKMGHYTGNTYTDLKNLFDNLKQYNTRSYPRLKMLIKGDGTNTINEDFFSFKISVVFPEWPARFQDIGFKSCVENLFKYHTPANVDISMLWLSIKKMRHFEPLYSTWKQNLLTNNNNYGAQHIIAFLSKESLK